MFNKLLKITFLGFLWSRYGTMFLSAVVLFAYFWVVGLIHEDYLSYLQLQGDGASAGWSFLMKWFAFLAGIGIFWWFNSFAGKKLESKGKGARLESSGHQNGKKNQAGENSTFFSEDDPFDEIRKKDKLRSKADLVIEKKS